MYCFLVDQRISPPKKKGCTINATPMCLGGGTVCIGQELKILMARFPDVGKYLLAMSREAFLPDSRHYEGNRWKAQKVDEFETRRLVQAALRDTTAEFGVENECRFLKVFGYLTVVGEAWNMLDLNHLEQFDLEHIDPNLRPLKHEMTAHWVRLAAQLATKPIPLQPGPVALLKKDDAGSANGMGVAGGTPGTSPFRDRRLNESFRSDDYAMMALGMRFAGSTSPFSDEELNKSLSRLNMVDFQKPTKWETFCEIILSLEFEKQVQSKVEALEEAEPEKYKQLTRSEISRLWQVQLQLSCGCGIVEVEGSIDPAHVGILATLLGHQMTHLQLVELNDFEVESKRVAESLAPLNEILILLVTKTGRFHQLVKKQCLHLQRQFPRQLRIILSFA